MWVQFDLGEGLRAHSWSFATGLPRASLRTTVARPVTEMLHTMRGLVFYVVIVSIVASALHVAASPLRVGTVANADKRSDALTEAQHAAGSLLHTADATPGSAEFQRGRRLQSAQESDFVALFSGSGHSATGYVAAGEYKYYKLEGVMPFNFPVQVALNPTDADGDLGVSCDMDFSTRGTSAAGGTSQDAVRAESGTLGCTPGRENTLYIYVYGFEATGFSIRAVPDNAIMETIEIGGISDHPDSLSSGESVVYTVSSVTAADLPLTVTVTPSSGDPDLSVTCDPTDDDTNQVSQNGANEEDTVVVDTGSAANCQNQGDLFVVYITVTAISRTSFVVGLRVNEHLALGTSKTVLMGTDSATIIPIEGVPVAYFPLVAHFKSATQSHILDVSCDPYLETSVTTATYANEGELIFTGTMTGCEGTNADTVYLKLTGTGSVAVGIWPLIADPGNLIPFQASTSAWYLENRQSVYFAKVVTADDLEQGLLVSITPEAGDVDLQAGCGAAPGNVFPLTSATSTLGGASQDSVTLTYANSGCLEEQPLSRIVARAEAYDDTGFTIQIGGSLVDAYNTIGLGYSITDHLASSDRDIYLLEAAYATGVTITLSPSDRDADLELVCGDDPLSGSTADGSYAAGTYEDTVTIGSDFWTMNTAGVCGDGNVFVVAYSVGGDTDYRLTVSGDPDVAGVVGSTASAIAGASTGMSVLVFVLLVCMLLYCRRRARKARAARGAAAAAAAPVAAPGRSAPAVTRPGAYPTDMMGAAGNPAAGTNPGAYPVPQNAMSYPAPTGTGAYPPPTSTVPPATQPYPQQPMSAYPPPAGYPAPASGAYAAAPAYPTGGAYPPPTNQALPAAYGGAVPPPAAAAGPQQRCNNCAADLPAGVRYCPVCGASADGGNNLPSNSVMV